MGKTKIEWADITLNPVRGKCPHGCEYCYAEGIRQRFKQPEEMSFHPEVIEQMLKLREPRTIFWGSMFDLFAKEVPDGWIHRIFKACVSEEGSKHNHVFLTKNPNRYRYFMKYKLGQSLLYFGASTTGTIGDFGYLVDFISVEPFTSGWMDYTFEDVADIDTECFIIGGLTGKGDPYKHTSYYSLISLVDAAYRAERKVFIKDNIFGYVGQILRDVQHKNLALVDFRQLPWELYTKSKTAGVE